MEKQCTNCDETKELDAFCKVSRSKDGRNTQCRQCLKEKGAAYRLANRDKERDRHRKYESNPANKEILKAKWKRNRENNREAKSEYRKKYYQENKDRFKEWGRVWQQKNRQKTRDSARQYREKNLESCRERDRIYNRENKDKRNALKSYRRAKLLQASPKWADKRAIGNFYAWARIMTEVSGEEFVVDHIVPLISEVVCGLHCEFNLQIISDSENSSKSNRFEPGYY